MVPGATPSRMGSTRIFALLSALIISFLLVPAPSLGASKDTARVDSLWRGGARDSSSALLRRLLDDTRDSAGTPPRGRILERIDLLTRASQQARFFGRGVPGERDAREAISLAASIGDSARVAAALRWLVVLVGIQGRSAESRALCDSLLALSLAIHDLRHEGWARIGLAWFAVQEGRAEDAFEENRIAADLFRRCKEPEGEIWALTSVGRVMSSRGRLKAAVDAYRRVVVLSKQNGDPIAEANALNDLGAIEFSLGDPGQALEMFNSSLAIHRRLKSVRETILPAVNVAQCLSILERHDEAESVLAGCLNVAREQSYRDLETMVLMNQAWLSRRRGQLHEAARRYRQVLAVGQDLPLYRQVTALEGLATAMYEMDSLRAAVDLVLQAAELLEGGDERHLLPLIRTDLGQGLLDLGRAADAMREGLAASEEASRLGLATEAVKGMVIAGRASMAMGQYREARERFISAARMWEGQRSAPLDPAWREERGFIGHLIAVDLALSVLRADSAEAAERSGGARQSRRKAIAEAHDRLQSLKARTRLERMLGPGEHPGYADSIRIDLATVERLQRDILRPGELLLDYFLGEDASLLFAITRDSLRVLPLPPEKELNEKLTLYSQAVARPPASRAERFDPGPLDRIGGRLARVLLGGVADLVAGSDRILVSPDGTIASVPMEEICTHLGPGNSGPEKQGPGQFWSSVPSSTILAGLRAGPGGRGSSEETPARLLVLAGATTQVPLRGSLREAAFLRNRYRNVRVRMLTTSRDTTAVCLVGTDVIHVAAHLFVDDRSPWRSEIQFLPSGAPVNLLACEIATLDLDARLAVLSSCSSAGGRLISGEGVSGITSAFLAAGVPAVVATLWPVDDRTTAILMEHFYLGLERGATAAEALHDAAAGVRSNPATSNPFYWAGFVLVGDGEVRIPVEPRPKWHAVLLWAAAITAVIGAITAIRRRSRISM
jgi:tetratricopeptide (TPR) repeat protein